MRKAVFVGIVAFCCGCSAPTASPVAPTSSVALVPSANDVEQSGMVHPNADGDPSLEWIHNPEDLNGHRGPDDNNCTFNFPGGDPDFHPEAICWERRAGHEQEWPNLFRLQFRDVHIASLPLCGGGAGDVEGIRACRLDDNGQPLVGANTPCGMPTGANGCRPCGQPIVTCH